ncbi:UNVERIFIED_CONTAM: hypothetical protein FKN15_051819 [Acipenser sinensis]
MNDSHIYGGSESSSEFWHIERPLACVILGLSFLIGVPGNLLVIMIILRHIKHRSHTVVLILNLAVCDFVVLITLPVWIYSLADAWVFGETLCKAMVYVIYSSMYGSVFLITLMSADRFVAIIYPFALQYWKRKGVLLKALAVIWILAFLFGVPTILTQRVDDVDGKLQCTVREYTSEMQEVVCLVLETLSGWMWHEEHKMCLYDTATELIQNKLREKIRHHRDTTDSSGKKADVSKVGIYKSEEGRKLGRMESGSRTKEKGDTENKTMD